MLLNDGELDGRRYLKAATLKQMTSNQLGDLPKVSFAPGMHMGLGFHVVAQPQEVTESLSVGTFGHGGAFATHGFIDPERKLVTVFMVQNVLVTGGGEARKAFHDELNRALGAAKP